MSSQVVRKYFHERGVCCPKIKRPIELIIVKTVIALNSGVSAYSEPFLGIPGTGKGGGSVAEALLLRFDLDQKMRVRLRDNQGDLWR